MVGLPGPFAGLWMNCRACHLVDEHTATQPDFMRTYTDFALRSPIPDRGDGKRTEPWNSPPLVIASLERPGGTLFHFDGDALRLFLDLFSQVVLDPHLLDRFQLRLDPIDVLVHVFGHILQHVPRGEVGHLRTMHHAIA